MRISESAQNPQQAKQTFLQCPHCHGVATVTFPWNPTWEQRQQLIHAAIDEHRRICTAVSSEEGRVTKIMYPR